MNRLNTLDSTVLKGGWLLAPAITIMYIFTVSRPSNTISFKFKYQIRRSY